MKNTGFIALPLLGWVTIGMGMVILSLGVGLKVQNSRLESCKAEYAAFVAQVKMAGEEAQGKANAERLRQAELLKKTESDYAKTKSALAVANRRLRDAARARGSGVPAAPAGSKRPDLICLDRAEYTRAYGTLTARLRELADEGAENALSLRTAQEWAHGLPTPPAPP